MSAPGEERAQRAPRPPWSAFRAALDAQGFRPSRRLGQNFLLDENLARAIARDAGFAPGERVLEVGPGCGFLSVHLAQAGARLLAVEIDPRLHAIARDFLAPYTGVELLLLDVLAGKHRLAPEVERRLPPGADERWHLVSNLPYSVGGPVLALCAARAAPPASMTVLVQREVAERLVAAPGAAAWGPLSIAVQAGYDGSILRSASPALFWPRPRVESSVVRFELRPGAPPHAERCALIELGAALLRRRRQTLGRVLADLLLDRGRARSALEELRLDPAARAETLSLESLGALARALDWRCSDGPGSRGEFGQKG
jgi:16S rRNA (adenine1518-N6/adenine1519-N6)-dimethyltransferase